MRHVIRWECLAPPDPTAPSSTLISSRVAKPMLLARETFRATDQLDELHLPKSRML